MSYFNSISECPAEQDIISHRKGQTSAEPCVISSYQGDQRPLCNFLFPVNKVFFLQLQQRN